MNKKEPCITIIVALYNGEKYINECINSIINQDYKNLEILLIDDGSPDCSGKIADEYAKNDARVKVIHQMNSGVSIARNNAIDMASGEYICIIDQDDIISRDYVSYFYKLIRKNNAEIALTPKVDKFFKAPKRSKGLKQEKTEIWDAEKTIIEMLYHKIPIAPWNKMISKNLIKQNNIKFNENFFNGEGFAFSIDCFQCANRIAVGNRKIYHYRVGDPNSGASRFKKEWIESSLNAQTYIKSSLKTENGKIIKAWNFSNWHTNCDALNVIIGCDAIRGNEKLYNKIKDKVQKEALCVFDAPISMQQKIRGILFKINPYIASKIINCFRNRKFKRNEDNDKD